MDLVGEAERRGVGAAATVAIGGTVALPSQAANCKQTMLREGSPTAPEPAAAETQTCFPQGGNPCLSCVASDRLARLKTRVCKPREVPSTQKTSMSGWARTLFPGRLAV